MPSVFLATAELQKSHFTVIPNDDNNSLSDLPPLTPHQLDDNEESIGEYIILEFDTGDKLIYCRDGHEDAVILTSHSFDPTSEILHYVIQFDNKRNLSTTREFL